VCCVVLCCVVLCCIVLCCVICCCAGRNCCMVCHVVQSAMLNSVPCCVAMVCCVMLCGDCCDRLEHTVIHKHAQTHIHPTTHPPTNSHTLADRYVLTHTTNSFQSLSIPPPPLTHTFHRLQRWRRGGRRDIRAGPLRTYDSGLPGMYVRSSGQSECALSASTLQGHG
jgi:hypothetical protein